MNKELSDENLEQVLGGIPEPILGVKNTFPNFSKKTEAPYELVLE